MSGWCVSAIKREQHVRYGTPSGGLEGNVCENGHMHFPQRKVCPECAYLLFAETGEKKQEEIPIPVEIPVAVALLADVSA